MKDIVILKDLLQSKFYMQMLYNQYLLEVRNPILKQLFTELRDDESRAIVLLQQKVESLQSFPGIIAKLIPGSKR